MYNWINNYNKLKSTYDLFFRALFFHDIHLEQQIINLVVTIEAFHRKMTGRKELIIFRLKNILEGIPSNMKNSFLGNEKEIAAFINTIVKIRNNLIHQNQNIEDLINAKDIRKLLTQLVVLIIILILANTGFSYDLIYSILKKKRLIRS